MIHTTKNIKIAIILLIVPVFMISLFFLYHVNFILQILAPLLSLIPIYFIMKNFEPKSRKKATLFTFLLVFLIFGILYLSNREFYNLSYPVMYQAFDEESYEMGREHFWYSESVALDFLNSEGATERAVLINPDDGSNIYLYKIDREIYESEVEIDTNGVEVKDILMYLYEPYFTMIEGSFGNEKTVIYELEADTGNYSKAWEFDGIWDTYGGYDEIILTKYETTGMDTDVIVFDGINEETYTVPFRIMNMHNVGPEWFVFAETYDPSWIVFRSFTNHITINEIIIDGIDDVTFQTGFEHLVINGAGYNLLYGLYDQKQTYFEREIHYNGDNLYLTGNKIYDVNINLVGEMLYFDLRGYVDGENRMYVTSNNNRAIVFDNERMVDIYAIGIEPGITIPAPYKHILLFISLILTSSFISYGYKREPLLFKKEVMYQVNKNVCPKCRSYNNYVTFPDTCDFCGNTDFKQNTT